MSTDNKNTKYSSKDSMIIGSSITIGILGVAGITGICMARHKTSKSNEWLVRTGLGIKDIQIGKKFF